MYKLCAQLGRTIRCSACRETGCAFPPYLGEEGDRFPLSKRMTTLTREKVPEGAVALASERSSGRLADTAPSPIRVLVVDDHEVVRSGIATLLERDTGLRVVGMASSAEEALESLASAKPHVVLLDYRLQGMSGTAACREIVRRHPEISVVILTSYLEDDIIHASLVAGARGYVLKNASRSDLVHTVRAVARGEAVLAPEVTERVIEWARRSKAIHHGADLLAPNEVEIVSLVAQGFSNREIAGKLRTSEHSVKLHLRSSMRKLGAKRRQEAVAIALRKGVI